jgi:hypothetical protein
VRIAGRDDGVIAIVVAAFALAMFGLAAIVVDLGSARQVRAQAQDTADAAALAGADALFPPSGRGPDFRAALDAISQSAAANFDTPTRLSQWTCPTFDRPPGFLWDDGARSRTRCVQFGRSPGKTTSQVFVATPARHVDSFFGGAIGFGGFDLSEAAAAGSSTTTVPTCGLCVAGSLAASGNSTIQVSVDRVCLALRRRARVDRRSRRRPSDIRGVDAGPSRGRAVQPSADRRRG